MAEYHVWTKDRPNILHPENIEKIRSALLKGPIWGHQYHFYGGCSRTSWAFADFLSFEGYLAASKPGDIYVVWSAAQLIEQKMALAYAAFDTTMKPGSSLLSEAQLEIIKRHLAQPSSEINCVFQNSNRIFDTTQDRGDYEDFLELVATFTQPGGRVYIFSENEIDSPEYILVEAKYPNVKGEVPIGGAY